MSAEPSSTLAQRKRRVRALAQANRHGQAQKETLSRTICGRLTSLVEYQAAHTVLFYVGRPEEVHTRDAIVAALASGKTVVVPYCTAEELELFHLRDMDELAAGTLGILEPKPALRGVGETRVDVSAVDLIVVPGVAFDRRGGRTGHGKGYYDKLLARARPETAVIALAFECQIFAEVPMARRDVFMDKVVTEQGVYSGQGRCP